MHCIANGHELIALANLQKIESENDELDSFMYQTVGHNIIPMYADALDTPLYTEPIRGSSISIESAYKETENDEVEDLYRLLVKVKLEHPDLEAISAGAILSNYQRIRVEHVCSRLNLVSLAYLWRRDQSELLQEMIHLGQLEAILVKVAAMGLEIKHLGKSLAEMQPTFEDLHSKYDVHVCGEGGEYETLTLDCPIFKNRITIDNAVTVIHSNDAFAPVAYLHINNAHLECKSEFGISDVLARSMIETNTKTYLKNLDVSTLCSLNNFGTKLIPKLSSYTKPTSKVVPIGSYLCIPGIQSLTRSNIKDETHQIFQQIQGLKILFIQIDMLNENGYTFEDIVLMTVYISDMTMFPKLNKVYGGYFGSNPPARVTVEAPLKGHVQIDVLATKIPKETMHIQSISYWAPANIGPYSQAVKVTQSLHCAGQIGLISQQMLLASDLETEIYLSLEHVTSIFTAMNFDGAVSCICYVIDIRIGDFARQCWQKRHGHTTLCFIEVSGLPRQANIEWQVVCGQGDLSPIISRSNEYWSLEYCYRGSVKSIVASMYPHRLATSLTVEALTGRIGSLATALRMIGLDSVATSARLFHNGDIPLDWIYCSVEGGSLNDICGLVTFVQVFRLENASLVLALEFL